MSQANNISLTATHGLLVGQTIYVEDQPILFGRVSQNDIVLAEHAVSRQHAKVFIQDEKLWIQDLGSKNGTLVNQASIQAHQNVELHHGDTVQMGTTIFSVAINEKTVQEASVMEPARTEKSTIQTFSQKEPKSSKKKFDFSLPPMNKRVVMYGSMIFILLLLVISSQVKKGAQQKNVLPIAQESQDIEIPEQFDLDSSQPIKIPTQGEIDTLLSQAQSAMRFEDYHKAIRIYERILRVRPEDAQIQTLYKNAKVNLYKKIQANIDIAEIELNKLNYEKAKMYWKRVAELTENLDKQQHANALNQIKTLEKLIQNAS